MNRDTKIITVMVLIGSLLIAIILFGLYCLVFSSHFRTGIFPFDKTTTATSIGKKTTRTTISVTLTTTTKAISTTTITSSSVPKREEKCYDSDGGISYYVKGYVTVNEGQTKDWDFCKGRILYEHACVLNKKTVYSQLCLYECEDGECTLPSFPETTTTGTRDNVTSPSITTTTIKEKCRGVPTPCSEFSTGMCELQKGCIVKPAKCYGTPQKCYVYLTYESCHNAGCFWVNETCVGKPRECKNFDRYDSCEEHQCLWKPAKCSGAATPCSEFRNQSSCTLQSGCRWVRIKE
jgi:hypothetical protein